MDPNLIVFYTQSYYRLPLKVALIILPSDRLDAK